MEKTIPAFERMHQNPRLSESEDTPSLTIEADTETFVGNVPDGGSTLMLLGIAMIALVPLASQFRSARVRADARHGAATISGNDLREPR
jgi:hypothetical protein